MKAERPRWWIVLADAVAVLALAALACTRDRTPAGPEPPNALPTSPLGAVESLAACWSRRDPDRYADLLLSDFVFTSGPDTSGTDTSGTAVDSLDRAQELLVARRMWRTGSSTQPPATSVSMRLYGAAEIDRIPAPAYSTVFADVDVEVRTPAMLYRVLGRCRFVVMCPDSLRRGLEPESPASSGGWYVTAWQDLGVHSDTSAARALPPSSMTIWRLKEIYLAP